MPKSFDGFSKCFDSIFTIPYSYGVWYCPSHAWGCSCARCTRIIGPILPVKGISYWKIGYSFIFQITGSILLVSRPDTWLVCGLPLLRRHPVPRTGAKIVCCGPDRGKHQGPTATNHHSDSTRSDIGDSHRGNISILKWWIVCWVWVRHWASPYRTVRGIFRDQRTGARARDATRGP